MEPPIRVNSVCFNIKGAADGSGVSYVTSDKTSIDDINVIRTWPGRDGEWKTPTRIAYAYENAKVKLTQDAWGYQVEPNMTSCSWTKLLLDHGAKVTKHDDPKLSKAVDEGMLRIPDSKTAQIVCEDFLREVYKHMVARLTRQLSAEVLESTPMDCWLTVPAVWSDQAQDATKKAAQAAGFGSRPSDSISVITEPEAAAIATLKKYLQPGAINPPQVGPCGRIRRHGLTISRLVKRSSYATVVVVPSTLPHTRS